MGKYIIFMCKEQQFALPIEVTEKILLFEKLTKVPDTSPYLLGLLSYEEKMLPVIDMKARLFQESLQSDEHTKIVVVLWKGMKIGLAVENVTTVLTLESNTKESEINEAEATNYIVEIFKRKDNMIMHLNVACLLSAEGEQEIRTLLEK